MTTEASELRPTSAPDASTAGETGPSQQLEHLFPVGHWLGDGGELLGRLRSGNPPKREKSSGLGDIHCTIPAGEPLTKVLPGGEPLHPAVAAMVPLDNDGSPL